MAITQSRPRRKVTGSKYVDLRKKKKHELGRNPTYTKIGNKKKKMLRVKGGNIKTILLTSDIVNLFNPKTKKYEKIKISTVLDNQANRNFIRRNILTKGTIVQTEKGKARITSRPGQEGTINAILIE